MAIYQASLEAKVLAKSIFIQCGAFWQRPSSGCRLKPVPNSRILAEETEFPISDEKCFKPRKIEVPVHNTA
jgi:hypothetical protein